MTKLTIQVIDFSNCTHPVKIQHSPHSFTLVHSNSHSLHRQTKTHDFEAFSLHHDDCKMCSILCALNNNNGTNEYAKTFANFPYIYWNKMNVTLLCNTENRLDDKQHPTNTDWRMNEWKWKKKHGRKQMFCTAHCSHRLTRCRQKLEEKTIIDQVPVEETTWIALAYIDYAQGVIWYSDATRSETEQFRMTFDVNSSME